MLYQLGGRNREDEAIIQQRPSIILTRSQGGTSRPQITPPLYLWTTIHLVFMDNNPRMVTYLKTVCHTSKGSNGGPLFRGVATYVKLILLFIKACLMKHDLLCFRIFYVNMYISLIYILKSDFTFNSSSENNRQHSRVFLLYRNYFRERFLRETEVLFITPSILTCKSRFTIMQCGTS